MEIKGMKINFLGDSITGGCKVESDKVFHVVIAQQEGCICNSYGEGGSCLSREINEEELKAWPACFCDRIDTMDPDADINVVFGGNNDYTHGSAPLGTPEDRTPETFYGACHYLIQNLLDKYPGKTLIFMTPTHYQGEMLPNRHGKIFKDYVKVIREVCEEYAVPVCDLFANSGIAPTVESQRELFIPDGDHPNARGHALIASRLLGLIRSL